MTTIQQTIAKAHYVATEAQVEQLASAQYTASAQAESHNLTYLRIVVVRCQAEVGTKRRGRALAVDSALAVVEKATEPLYAAVLRGITTPDIVAEPGLEPAESSRRALERNRRSTFARSAKTTLVNYVRGGGDIRGLDPETVTKAGLRAAVTPPEPANRDERIMERAQGAILRAINRQARGDPAAAQAALEGVIAALQERLEAMTGEQPDHGATTTVAVPAVRDRGPARTRVGVPQFHRGA
jgi:hypothetical protein